MAEYLWPPDIIPSSQVWGIVDNTGSFQSPLSGTVRTVSRAGSRLRCTITIPPVKGEERARIKAAFGGLRMSDTMWVTDFTTDRRGSISTPELLTNNDFSNGTTGWTAANCALSASDGVLRLTNTKAGGAASFNVYQGGMAVSQYAPYAMRGFAKHPPRSGIAGGTYMESVSNYSTSPDGFKTQVAVVLGTTAGNAYPILSDTNGTASISGDVAELYWASYARCALVDNGPNALLYSDQIDNAAWTKAELSVSANSDVAADGTSTADRITETTVNAEHSFTQSGSRASAAEDLCAWGIFKQAVLDRDIRLTIGSDGSNFSRCTFDLSAGTAGAVSNTGTATNGRASISSLGNGYYLCVVVMRAAASTTIYSEYGLVDAGSISYLGTTGALIAWRCGAARSGVPTRGSQTTTTATTGTAQTGSGIYLKGLPASTSGLLKAGDPVQIGSQKNFAIAPLDSDAAGLGYLQCALPWLASAADNAPVIFNTPMSKMRLAKEIDWDTGPGQFSGFQLEFVEDVS